jgi:uncharacterized membrane protein YgcG
MEQFFTGFKKGSKQIRKVITKDRKVKKVTQLQTVKTFFRLVGIPVPTEMVVGAIIKVWSYGFLTNRCREFTFKFYNNILGTNARVANFNAGTNPACTFCTLEKVQDPPDESFIHLFWDCPQTDKLRKKLENEWFPEVAGASNIEKKEFWLCGKLPGGAGGGGGSQEIFSTKA